jgi:hypothetical protein
VKIFHAHLKTSIITSSANFFDRKKQGKMIAEKYIDNAWTDEHFNDPKILKYFTNNLLKIFEENITNQSFNKKIGFRDVPAHIFFSSFLLFYIYLCRAIHSSLFNL